ncbi:MAG: hypothetical protein GY827_08375 [Cytophagales bacterium]|nr:hypothetical protein [Cytophagales bacterium]
MYVINIPINVKKEIVKTLQELTKTIYTPIRYKKFLLVAYYRYVEPLRGGETVDEKVKRGLGCAVCFGDVKKYFKKNKMIYINDIKTAGKQD